MTGIPFRSREFAFLGVLAVAGIGPVAAQKPAQAKAAVAIMPSVADVSRADLDTTIAPCHDFHQYATGGWYRRTPYELRQEPVHGPEKVRTGVALRQLVARAAALASITQDRTLKVVGHFYGSCLTDASGRAEGAVGDTVRASYCFRATRQHLDRALFELLMEYVWLPLARAETKQFWPNMQAAAGKLFERSTVLPDSTKQQLMALSAEIRLYASEAGRPRDSTTEWWAGSQSARPSPLAAAARRPSDVPFTGVIGATWGYRDYAGFSLSPTDFVSNMARLGAVPDPSPPPALPGPIEGRAPTQLNLLDVLLGEKSYEAGVGNRKASVPLGMLIPPVIDGTIDLGAWYGLIGPVMGHEMSHGTLRGGGQKTPLTILDRERQVAFVNELFRGQTGFGHDFDDALGVLIAYGAFQRALMARSWPSIEGFTPEQRFFLGVARGWRGGPVSVNPSDNARPRWRVLTNGTLSAMPEFAQAFGCKADDPMAGGKIWYQDVWGSIILTPEERQELYRSYIYHTFHPFWGLGFGGRAGEPSTTTAEQTTRLDQIASAQAVQQDVLIDSLRADVDFAAGARRMLQLLARQIGERRATLTPAQQVKLDPQIQRWIRLHEAKAGRITIPGVQSSDGRE